MERQTHTEDLRNVHETDVVTIETTTGRRFAEVECVSCQTQQADTRSGEVRETIIWRFDVNGRDLVASIVDGLKSSPDDPDFPVHKEASLGNVGEYDGWVNLGYFETVEIHGISIEA
jgi:hypothetical protein